jgi:hypothetical protein
MASKTHFSPLHDFPGPVDSKKINQARQLARSFQDEKHKYTYT